MDAEVFGILLDFPWRFLRTFMRNSRNMSHEVDELSEPEQSQLLKSSRIQNTNYKSTHLRVKKVSVTGLSSSSLISNVS